MHLQVPLLPVPDLTHPEAAVDLELVHASGRPDHLDRDVRALGLLRLRAEHVTLVRLGAPELLSLLQRPRAERQKADAALEAIGLEETADDRLDLLVIARRAHDLQLPLQVREPWRRAVPADLEEALVVFPAHARELDDVVFDGRVVTLLECADRVHARESSTGHAGGRRAERRSRAAELRRADAAGPDRGEREPRGTEVRSPPPPLRPFHPVRLATCAADGRSAG